MDWTHPATLTGIWAFALLGAAIMLLGVLYDTRQAIWDVTGRVDLGLTRALEVLEVLAERVGPLAHEMRATTAQLTDIRQRLDAILAAMGSSHHAYQAAAMRRIDELVRAGQTGEAELEYQTLTNCHWFRAHEFVKELVQTQVRRREQVR